MCWQVTLAPFTRFPQFYLLQNRCWWLQLCVPCKQQTVRRIVRSKTSKLQKWHTQKVGKEGSRDIEKTQHTISSFIPGINFTEHHNPDFTLVRITMRVRGRVCWWLSSVRGGTFSLVWQTQHSHSQGRAYFYIYNILDEKKDQQKAIET